MRIFKLSHTVILITLVTGCASFEKKPSTAALQQNQISNTQVSEQVNNAAAQVEQRYLSAENENYPFYAPNTWYSIQKSLASMRILVNKFDPNDQGFFGGPSESSVLASIAEVSDELRLAQGTKNKVTTFLAKPLADIEYLTPKIDEQRKRELAGINKDLTQLINMVEKDYAQPRQDAYRDKLQKRIHTLEIDIVTAEYYSPLEAQFNQLNQRLIPQSYNNVLQGLQQLDNTIISEPRNKNELESAAKLVEKDIKSAEHVTTDVNWINTLNKSQREKIVLNYRSTLEGLGHKFIGKDLSALSYKEQAQTLNLALSAKFAEFENQNKEVIIAESSATPEISPTKVNQVKNTIDASSVNESIKTTQVTTDTTISKP